MKKQINQITILLKSNELNMYWGLFIGLILFRVWLITGVPKMFIFGPHDDLFYVRSAHSMLRGHWMGVYNEYTLIKGPFYVFFLVGSFISGLPLYINETLFYIGACLIIFIAIKPLIINKWLSLLLFITVLFLPSSLINWFHLRVYREFVYYSLTLYITGFAIGLFLRVSNKPLEMLRWSIGLGLSMGAFLITREEGVWIFPTLFFLILASIIFIIRSDNKKKTFRIIISILPIVLWYLPVLIVSYLNFNHYGFWGVSELREPEFNRVMKNLSRIKAGSWHPAIQITNQARMEAYEVSPTLAEHKERIENYVMVYHTYHVESMRLKPEWYLSRYGDGDGEIGSFFLWLLRSVPAHTGMYSDGNYPKGFYKQIADELEIACKTGELECKNPSISPAIIGSVEPQHIPIIIRMFGENIFRLIKQEFVGMQALNISQSWPRWGNSVEDYLAYEMLTYNPIDVDNLNSDEDFPQIIYGVSDLRYRTIIYKESVMRIIKRMYAIFSFPFFILSFGYFLVKLFSLKFGNNVKNDQYLIVSCLIIGLLFSRTLTLTIIDATTAIPGIHYITSANMFVPLFSMVLVFLFISKEK